MRRTAGGADPRGGARLAREASAALPTPRWDPSEEAANKERRASARGLVGKKTARDAARGSRRPADTRARASPVIDFREINRRA